MKTKPFTDEQLLESTLRIFAARAAGELERMKMVEQLQQAHDELELRVSQRTAELTESNSKFRHLFDHANNAIFIVELKDLRIIDVNENAARQLGYTRKQLLKMNIDELSAPESAISNEHILDELQKTGSVIFEHIHLRKDGSLMPVEVSSRVIKVGDQQVIQSFVRDIESRKKDESERERLLGELENKNQDLQQILHISSHDLRSPLVSIQGFSGILDKAMSKIKQLITNENGSLSNGTKEELDPLLLTEIPGALDHIQASTEKMGTLLSGLMRLSRLGQTGMTVTDLDMNQMLSEIVKSINYLVGKANVQLNIDDLPPSRGDVVLISQVFSNLLSNALKYLNADRPGMIKIAGERKDDVIVYTVEDNGIGIPPEYQPRVFDLFHRVNPNHTTGEGLGLTITRKILERHHGRVWLESEFGTGSKFYVELPV